MEGMADVFSKKASGSASDHEHTFKELHAKMGQATVEWVFVAKAFGK